MMRSNFNWSEAAADMDRSATPYAVATVLATAGSTPRNSGSKIVISADDTYASIGGGQLEFLVVERARELILAGLDCQEIKQFPLGAEARQCCGGAVTVLLECFAKVKMPVVVFGAGHVSNALMPILQSLPFDLTCIDSRNEMIVEKRDDARFKQLIVEKPDLCISELPDGASVIVMTHDHLLDYRIVSKLLESWRWRFVGLIGSENKARRFRARLIRDGIDRAHIDMLDCPVGIPEVKGKLPMEVAVSIAARLIEVGNSGDPESDGSALDWKQMKALLKNTAS